MMKIIKAILKALGYEIVKFASGVPASTHTFANFTNVISAYEKLFQENQQFFFSANPSRTVLLARLRGTPPSEAYFIIKSLFQTKDVEGDICEFGVAQGETSALIANEIRESEKIFHLFDSFAGLSDPTTEDELKDDIFSLGSMNAYKGKMSYQKNWVLSRLDAVEFPQKRYSLHEGFIEDVIAHEQNLPEKVAFAYVDFDLYAPIKTALEFLHTRTVKGAIIMIDDYDFFSTGVKKAVDEFLQANVNYQIDVPSSDFGHFAILHKKQS
ncbi:MAG: hypothetical protein CVU44_06925 [Chloroflexi bacterium HGW-Chloroflexi-6]|nr:MAG: hypothetical protein CVU44_06925 [Chloroflexi bacterium HGW-Chloroflexi-6]